MGLIKGPSYRQVHLIVQVSSLVMILNLFYFAATKVCKGIFIYLFGLNNIGCILSLAYGVVYQERFFMVMIFYAVQKCGW